MFGNPPLVPGYYPQNSSYPRQIQHSARQFLKTRQTSQYRMVPGSNSGKLQLSNAQFSQCGFVCNSIQSQTPIVCISSSGQSSLCHRGIINELEQSTCLCIFTYTSDTKYSNQNLSISLQSSSDCTSLASTSWFLRGVTATSLSQDLTSILSKLTNTSKRKVSTQNLPTLALQAWVLSSNQ